MKTLHIERANKINGQNRTVVEQRLGDISDMLVFHTSRQSGWNPCEINNGGCSHLCLASSSLDLNASSPSIHCACSTHYTLDSNNKTCSGKYHILLITVLLTNLPCGQNCVFNELKLIVLVILIKLTFKNEFLVALL